LIKSVSIATALTIILLTGPGSNTQAADTTQTPAQTAAHETSAPISSAVRYRTIDIEGTEIFYREAGPKNAPVVLLLHGFPSSSHMFRNLIPALSDTYRVIAPDYPGFGYSAQPKPSEFDYSFANIANIIEKFTDLIGAKRYVIYMQDYGGPVGFRLALKKPERITGLIIQNAAIDASGWNPDIVKQFKPFWQERTAKTEKPLRGFLTKQTTKWQYMQGSTRANRLSPDAWTHDQSGLDSKGNKAIQLQYLWNYQDNFTQYSKWQAYLKDKQPPVLVVWGKNDPFFTLSSVNMIKSLVPKAEINLYNAGHFALETHGDEIAASIRKFLAAKLK